MPNLTEESRLLSDLFKQRADMSQRAFGEKHGIGSGAMVWQYLKGNRPLNLKAACRFARGLGIPVQQFSPRLAKEFAELTHAGLALTPPTRSEYDEVNYVTLRLRHGSPAYDLEPADPAASHIAFRRDWLKLKGYAPEKLVAVQCPDDAMRTSIGKGDLVVINTGDRRLAEGHVFAVNYEGTLCLRRVFRDLGSWWLHSDNPDTRQHPRKQFFDKQCFSIGRVVHRQSESI